MPLLEYRCSDCGKKTEELILAGDVAARPRCDACGSRKVTRLLSTFATHAASGKDAFPGCAAPESACEGGDCAMPEACGAGADDWD